MAHTDGLYSVINPAANGEGTAEKQQASVHLHIRPAEDSGWLLTTPCRGLRSLSARPLYRCWGKEPRCRRCMVQPACPHHSTADCLLCRPESTMLYLLLVAPITNSSTFNNRVEGAFLTCQKQSIECSLPHSYVLLPVRTARCAATPSCVSTTGQKRSHLVFALLIIKSSATCHLSVQPWCYFTNRRCWGWCKMADMWWTLGCRSHPRRTLAVLPPLHSASRQDSSQPAEIAAMESRRLQGPSA